MKKFLLPAKRETILGDEASSVKLPVCIADSSKKKRAALADIPPDVIKIESDAGSSSDFDLNQPDLNEGDFDSDGRLSPEDRHNGPAAEVLHISAIAQSSSILPLRGEEWGISGPTG